MTVESPGPSGRLPSIQYLRAAAALGVLLFHATLVAGHPARWGAYGVPLFFVISGFVMVWITDEHSRPRRFLADRFRRVVPLYWIATAAAALLFALMNGRLPGLRAIAASILFVPYGQPTLGRIYFPVLAVGWTLNYEIMFYLLFAAALLLPRRFQLAALTASLVSLAGAGYLFRPSYAPLDFWCAPFGLQFLVGAFLAATVKPERAGVRRGLAAAGLVTMLLLAPNAMPAAALVVGGLWLDGWKKGGGAGALLYLGDASYSIYLWHTLGIEIGAVAAHRLQLAPAGLLATLLAAGLLSGLAAYHVVERPLLRLLKRPRGEAVPPFTAESAAIPRQTGAAGRP